MKNKKFCMLSVLNLLIITALVLAACSQANPNAAPVLPTSTSVILPSPTPAPILPIVTSIPLPSPTKAPTVFATTGTSSTTASVAQGQIVFWDDFGASDRQQIYIEQADGSNLRQLVISNFNDQYPSLSPDGKTVVFRRVYSGDYTSTYLVNVDGTDLHQLDAGGCVKPCVNREVEAHPWSPDGKQIAFVRANVDANGKYYGVGWWVMKADGSGAHLMWIMTDAAEDHYVRWSPDGKRFVFMRIDNTASPVHSAIFTMATDKSDLKQITPWELNAGDPAWSPDGTLIVFQSPAEPNQGGGVQNIYTIHPDGTALTQLTTYTSADASSHRSFGADWSPDGSQIVFSHFPSTYGSSDLFVMNRDGSGLHLLAHTLPNENNADWGPSPTR